MHLCTYGILGAYHIGNDTDGDDDDDNCGQLWAAMTSNAWVDDVNVAPFPLSVDEHLFSSIFRWGFVFKHFWTIICFQVYLDEHLISSSFDEHLFSSIFISQFEKLECLMFCHQMIGRKHFQLIDVFFKVGFLPCKTLWLWLCSKCWRHCHQKGENQNCIVHRIAYLKAMTNINIVKLSSSIYYFQNELLPYCPAELVARHANEYYQVWIRLDREFVIFLHIAFFTIDQSTNNHPGGQSPGCLPVWNCCLLLSSGELHEKKCQASSSSSSLL